MTAEQQCEAKVFAACEIRRCSLAAGHEGMHKVNLRKCWICERQFSGEECPSCGPPQPWGPTPEERREEERSIRVEQYWKDKQGDDYGSY